MPETPLAVANYFIRKAAAEGESLTPMKAIKLVYIAHGWHLGLKQKPLITDPIEAWQYGPVIRELYYQFKKYGDSAIPLDAIPSWVAKLADPSKATFLDQVWDAYRGFSAVQLSTLTHRTGTPWEITWNILGGKTEKGALIDTGLIREHYAKKAQAS